MRKAGAILLLGVSAALAACGVGGSGSGGGSGPGSGSIAVQIFPTQATLHPNDTQQFTATVTGTSNTAVTWEVNNVPGGNSTVGTITAQGFYVAPANVPNPSTVTVTAVSQANPTKSASAPVTIVSPTTVIVTVSPSTATVAANGTQQFTATVTGTSNTAVTWEVNNIAGGNSTFGTISSTGLYTAPANVPNPSTVTVTAVSQADPTKSGSAQVTIVSSTTVAVNVSPSSATVAVGGTQQFTATVTGTTNTAVTWEVNNIAGGNSTVGAISSIGLYTAPVNVPNPNPVTVTAVSQADPTKSGSALVTILPGITVAVSPSSANVVVGAVQQFAATVTGTTNTAVTWEVNGITGGNSTVGTISTTGLYKAPSTAPSANPVTVTAVSQANSTKSGSAAVTIIQFSSGSVIGQYAFEFTGQVANGPLFLAGSFHADGNGTVTSGMQDRIDVSGVSSLPITGTYSLGLDGRGTLTLTSSNGTTVDYRFVMDGRDRAALIGFNGTTTTEGYGLLAKQNTSAFSVSAIANNWAFGVTGTVVSGMTSTGQAVEAGRFTVDAMGNITAGAQDQNFGGVVTSNVPFTGSVSSPDGSTGRAVATLGSLQYAFYIVSSSEFFMTTISPVSPTQAMAFVGRAAQQSGAPFTNSSFSGAYAFEWSGQGGPATSVVAEVGQMTADGSGGISNGTFDLNELPGAQGPVSFTGTYALDSSGNGRGTMTVTGNQPSTHYAFYMASPASAFFVSADSLTVLAGVALAQSGGTFSNSSFAGSYGYTVNGFVTGVPEDTSGQLLPDANGNITGAADTNAGGMLNPNQTIQLGVYSASSVNGRFTLTILLTGTPPPPPANYVMYLVDPGHGFLVQTDSQSILVGTAAAQF